MSRHAHPTPAQTFHTGSRPQGLRLSPSNFSDDGLITAPDFRDFTFANAVRRWGTGNPRFFEGTAVARAAAAVLEGRSA